jgi:flavin reductase (DIM6/NTAB) family NADH-FMN oxidoreductase RutF
MIFKEIDPLELSSMNAFRAIGKEWFLICAESDGVKNAMTASWGFLGNLWNKNAAVCFIRPQRFTHTLTENCERVSLCFFGDGYRTELGKIFGRMSGKDTDKAAVADFHYTELDSVPAFEEANLVLICRKMYSDKIKPECFIDREADSKCYPLKDYHTVYICEVEKAYIKE